jgi:hypothetical protein
VTFYIGWTDEERRRNLGKVVRDNRFLVMPLARINILFSHVLAQSLRSLRRDWKERHGQAPGLAETFVDGGRFKGTSYLAANWKRIGETLGYGKRGKAFEYHGEMKTCPCMNWKRIRERSAPSSATAPASQEA